MTFAAKDANNVTQNIKTADDIVAVLPAALGAGNGLKIDGSGVPLPISTASLPLPSGAATDATVAAMSAKFPANLTVTATRLLTDSSGVTQPISAASLPLPTGAALDATVVTTNTEIGALVETVPASDTASSGLNGRLQRIAQRITTLIALLPTALATGGGLKVAIVNSAGTQIDPLSPGNTVMATSSSVTVSSNDAVVGPVTETAPATDTASSGLNGRLQRISQRLTALLPASLGANVEVVPAVTASAYTAGNVIGGIMTFANILPANFNGVLESITLKFKGSVQAAEYDVALFTASPAGTYTDKTAPTFNAADSALLLGVFPLTVNQSTLGTHTVYTLDGIAKLIVGTATSLYAVVTTKGTPTPASTSDMSLRLGMLF